MAQFALYIVGFLNYKSKLDDLAENLTEKFSDATVRAVQGVTREQTKSSSTTTTSCLTTSSVSLTSLRSRGAPGTRYGEAIRGTYQANNGYTPLRNVAVANLLGKDMASAPSLKRAQTKIAERANKDDHELQRWQAIISAPTQSAPD